MKTEALEVLKNRRSIRKFQKTQVNQDTLDLVLQAGTYAPTANGDQQPVIVAVRNPEQVEELDRLNARVLNSEGHAHPYYGAPMILFVLAPADGIAPVEDASLVAGNLMNAAYAVGLGSCWIHRAREVFETEEGKELLKKWGLPENMMGVASIAMGYPDCEMPKAAPRKKDYIVQVD